LEVLPSEEDNDLKNHNKQMIFSFYLKIIFREISDKRKNALSLILNRSLNECSPEEFLELF